MNGWDLFTWVNAVALLLGVLIIFAGFLRDARGILKQARGEKL